MKLIDCFLQDDLRGAMPLYDHDPKMRAYFATDTGIGSQPPGKKHVIVPLFPFTDEELEDRAALLLLEAVKDWGWRYNKLPYIHAQATFPQRDLELYKVLSSSDSPRFRKGWRLAVAYPEFVGKVCYSGEKRGIALFNPDAVIGYKGRGPTAWKSVLDDDFLA